MDNKYSAKSYQRRNPPFTIEEYSALHAQSINDPTGFWGIQSEHLSWFKRFDNVLTGDFSSGKFSWFDGGQLNACYNCVDRHVPHYGDEIALIWEGNNPNTNTTLTYRELRDKVSQFANGLKARNIKKGDRICIYMPMIPEAIFAMLACARIGAIHSVVFGGFSAAAIASRIQDADCCAVITADEAHRGDKRIPLKTSVDEALDQCPQVHTSIVVKNTGSDIAWYEQRDVWLHELIKDISCDCPCEEMKAEDPLFILYTSGSTGQPKGVLHTTAGYLLYTMMTFKTVFDYLPGEVYWCTADIGWITGHSYMVYGPLASRATVLMYEGVPAYPNPARFWEIIDKHKVNHFYTAPTALRALMREGNEHLQSSSRESLQILGTVGEPINPDVWQWYYQQVGNSHCPIVDTWWQTETGGFMLSPIPGVTDLKPGCATLPFYGANPVLLDENNQPAADTGKLCFTQPWPGLIRTVYGKHQRFIDTYLGDAHDHYVSGDGATRDEDGYYWITGRMDDVINVSGHRLGTAEIESALVSHASVAEAAVVGIPHDIKGEALYAYVVLKKEFSVSDQLNDELMQSVKSQIGTFAKPENIRFVTDLPKTRSGKIMRRILKKIAQGHTENLGDISTLADKEIINQLISK